LDVGSDGGGVSFLAGSRVDALFGQHQKLLGFGFIEVVALDTPKGLEDT